MPLLSEHLPRETHTNIHSHTQIVIATPATATLPPRLRSRCFINGCPVTLRALRVLNGLLVDMNGQHSSLALADPSTQMGLLDRVAGCVGLKAEVCVLSCVYYLNWEPCKLRNKAGGSSFPFLLRMHVACFTGVMHSESHASSGRET